MRKKTAAENTLYLSMVGLPLGHKHFYHFFIDLFPAVFTLVNAFPNLQKLHQAGFDNLKILLREDLTAFQKQAYEYITASYPHIETECLKANEMLVGVATLYYDFKQNIHSSYLPSDYISFLRGIYAPHLLDGALEKNVPLSRRYYISRGDTKNRNIQNEDEIMALLSPLGFQRIYPAQLPFAKQIEIFSTAEVIIAAAGAAFTNLIYANPHLKATIFYPEGISGSQYLWLGKSVGIGDMQHLIVPNRSGHRSHSEIPIELIKSALGDIGLLLS